MNYRNVDASTFWSRDLEEIESGFLKGKVTELSVGLDDRVPTQGSVILDRTVDVDKEVKMPSFLKRLVIRFIR